jgi:hypothetical protein
MNNLEEISVDNKDKNKDEENKQPILNTKEELIVNIKEWIKMDNELTKLKLDVKEKTNKKKQLTETLVSVMKHNAIDCFDINGGALVYKQKKTKKNNFWKILTNTITRIL